MGVGGYCSRDLSVDGYCSWDLVGVDLGVGGYCSWDLGVLTSVMVGVDLGALMVDWERTCEIEYLLTWSGPVSADCIGVSLSWC